MNIALFSIDGILFLLRWLHVFFGVVWIGMLYYFNFVQGSFMAETDAGAKSQVTQKLLPRALWWFRYGALWTVITGLCIIMIRAHQGGIDSFVSSWGAIILSGMLLGLVMAANVWFVIWPNQKIVIANAVDVATGKPANPNAAASAAKGLLASRHNTLFSIPMMFFMTGARHLAPFMGQGSGFAAYMIIFLIILAALEFNALKGKLSVLTTIKGVVTSGFVLTLVFYIALQLFI